ncbi:hypothetical protein X975_06564, partial [Stegodyphus mimosarum]
MNNSFSPRYNCNNPRMTFQQNNRFHSPHNHRFQSPCTPNQMGFGPNYSSPVERFSPRSTPPFHHQVSPCTPKQMGFAKSPNYNSPVERYSPRCTPPFQQNSSMPYNRSSNNREQISNGSNLSFSPDNNSSSYFGDVSRGSPYNLQYKNRRFQNKKCFESPNSSDSNPGHTPDIRQY